MALIDCPECGTQVSSAAVSCPECGTQVSSAAVSCPKCAYPIAEAVQDALGNTEEPKPRRPSTKS